jgi:hypothetical protein
LSEEAIKKILKEEEEEWQRLQRKRYSTWTFMYKSTQLNRISQNFFLDF